MSLISRWEAKITIPTGGLKFDLDESGGGTGVDDITLTAAETYYWNSTGSEANDLVAQLKAKLEAASLTNGNGFVYTVTLNSGEGGNGKLSITVSAGTFTMTNVSADLLALMGFDADLSPTAETHTSDNHVEALWLPGVTVDTPWGLDSSGLVISAASESLSEDGTYFASHGSKHTRNEYVYRACPVARVVAASESVTNESYETFWLDAVRGEEPWAVAGRELRYYKDVDDDATYKTYNMVNVVSPNITRRADDYDGLWNVQLDVVEN